MSKKREIIQKIPSQYVADDCVQVMLAHRKDSMTLINQKEVIYHSKQNTNEYINNYSKDDRRKMFPYHDIPSHIERRKGRKVFMVNQILEYDTPYIQISDNSVKEVFVTKIGKDAYIITKALTPQKTGTQTMNQEQIRELRTSAELYDLNGVHYKEAYITEEDELLEWYRKKYYQIMVTSLSLDFEEQVELHNMIARIKLDDIPKNIPMYEENHLYIKTPSSKNSSLQINQYDIRFLSHDCYQVTTYEYPTTNYTLDQIREIANKELEKMHGPKFPKLLNKFLKQKN